jgi:hypothetical protein
MKDNIAFFFGVKQKHPFWTASSQMMKVQSSFLDYDVFSIRPKDTED